MTDTNEKKPREKVLWHYSINGIAAGKNFQLFHQLLGEAIKLAPSTVKFTSPDIEKLEKERDDLTIQAEKLAGALEVCATRKECRGYECCGNCGPIYEAEEALEQFKKYKEGK